MRKGWLLMRFGAAFAICAAGLRGAGLRAQYSSQTAEQNASPVTVTGKGTCACGAHPPGPPKDRVVEPYAGEPADLSPYEKFASPYDLNYTHPKIYSGAGRDIPEPKDISEVRIGFFGPIEHNPEAGLRIAHVARRAIGGGRGQCARRLRRQALPADAAQRLRQLAGQGGLRRGPAHRSRRSGARPRMKR